jgi:hypothetical protein
MLADLTRQTRFVKKKHYFEKTAEAPVAVRLVQIFFILDQHGPQTWIYFQ